MKISITCITPVLQAILDFFPDIISFQHVFHLGVGRSQMEWKFKVKTQILVFPWAKIGQNDHSNPYIESTTVLSDIYIERECLCLSLYTYILCPPTSVLVPRRAPYYVQIAQGSLKVQWSYLLHSSLKSSLPWRGRPGQRATLCCTLLVEYKFIATYTCRQRSACGKLTSLSMHVFHSSEHACID